MSLRAFIFAAMIAFSAAMVPGTASACEAQARAVAQQNNARLLAVTAQGNKCVVKLLIRRNGQPPQRKTVVVSRK